MTNLKVGMQVSFYDPKTLTVVHRAKVESVGRVSVADTHLIDAAQTCVDGMATRSSPSMHPSDVTFNVTGSSGAKTLISRVWEVALDATQPAPTQPLTNLLMDIDDWDGRGAVFKNNYLHVRCAISTELYTRGCH
jgi:hypothetical protein